MHLVYREMTTAALPAVFAVRVSTVENAVTMRSLQDDYGITPETLAAAMQADVKGWLCEDDGTVVGFAMGDRSNAEVQVVAVRPGHEGRGIGKDLLLRVQRWLFDAGHDPIWLRANPDPSVRATGFYRRLGWRRTDRFIGGDQVLTLHRADAPPGTWSLDR